MSFKYLFSLLLIISIFQNSEAQERRFNAGLLLGFNASQIQGDAEAGYNKVGLLTGLTAEIRLAEKSEIGLEITFSQLGSRSVNRSTNFTEFKATLNYVMVPVYFKYKDWYMEEDQYYRLHFLGGLSYGRLFSTKMEGEPFEAVNDFLRDDYLGVLIGAVYQINSKLGVGARYEQGLLDIYNNNFDEGPNISRVSLSSKHLALYATYFFL